MKSKNNRSVFNEPAYYWDLLSGAHRKPATVISTPTLTCHLAFWYPFDRTDPHTVDISRTEPAAPSDSQDSDYQNKKRETWKRHIDHYIFTLYCLLVDTQQFECQTTYTFNGKTQIFLFSHAIDVATCTLESLPHDSYGNDATIPVDDDTRSRNKYYNSDYKAVIFRFYWNHIFTRIRFELHQEYFSITTFLDTNRLTAPFATRDAARKNRKYRMLFDQFHKLNDILSDHHANGQSPRPTRRSTQRLHFALYERVWEFFYDSVLLSSARIRLTANSYLISTPRDFREKLGDVFADFRGIVLNSNTSESNDFFRIPPWKHPTKAAEFLAPRRWSAKESADCVDRLWPFLTADSELDLSRYEFTCSRMLGGRAIYITALGVQPAVQQKRRIPLYYLLHCQTQSRWQIGRLVDNIHHLGTVRLAALQQLAALRAASLVLRHLADRADLVASNLPRIAPVAPEAEPGEQKEHDKVSDVERLFAEVSYLESALATQSRGFRVRAGLMYRVERSRYYVAQFRNGVKWLRIRRIEGFQPYDVFVERRLGATFDFIDRLGRRYERLERRLESLNDYFLAHSAIKSADSAMKNTETLVEIQAAAEVAFFCLLAPYYLISVIKYTLQGYIESFGGFVSSYLTKWFSLPDAIARLTVGLDFSMWPAFYLAIWIGFGLFGIRRGRQIKRGKPRKA